MAYGFVEKPKAPPVGTEHLSNSTGKSHVCPDGGAKSGAPIPIAPDLAFVIESWPLLSAQTRAKLVSITKRGSAPTAT
jgi:hypothetical protein